MDSHVRNNPYHFTRLFGPNNQGTVFGRAEALMGHDAMVGRACTGLKKALGVSGLHKVRPKVEFVSRCTILPPDLFKRFQGMEFWRDLNATQANVIASKPTHVVNAEEN